MTASQKCQRQPSSSSSEKNLSAGVIEVREGLAALRPQLFGRALRLTRSPSRAEDVVQETMLRALRFEGQYRAGTNLKAWVNQVLMSVFLTQCRKFKREQRAMDNLKHDPATWSKKVNVAPELPLMESTKLALNTLPESYRAAIELVDLAELSYRDAAAKLQVPVGTIMSRLHRGRKKLAQLLAPNLALAAA